MRKSKTFVNYFEGRVTKQHDDFCDVLHEVIRMSKDDSFEISKEAEELFMQLIKKTEERKKRRIMNSI